MPASLYRDFFIRKAELATDTQHIFYSFLNLVGRAIKYFFYLYFFLHMLYNLINGFDHFGVILNTLNLKNLILQLWRFLLRQN